ncbi:MAG: hypothetical protein COC01_07430 [Bacteroidetes bacterium]|nr:MAG: hypothetical protein COC01_07430 [Bacteroidota bacterium]
MRRIIYIGLFFFTPIVLQAQTVNEDLIEALAENSDEDLDYTSLLEILSYYEEHPLNVNKASKEDLQSCFLLNDFQIQALLDHKDKHGKLLNIYELQTINGFTPALIRLLEPYIDVSMDLVSEGRYSIKERIKSGKGQLFVRVQTIVEDQEGYDRSDTTKTYYLGSKYKSYNRFKFSSGTKLSFGFTMEKDPGEEFFKGSQPNGFDFYSAHFFVKDIGRVKALAIGDYELQIGQGLTFWSGLAFGKSNNAMNIKKIPRGLKQYTSVNENLFLRGFATTINFNKLDWTVMYSSKAVDGNLVNSDDLVDVEFLDITSLQTSGFHRTESELEDKHGLNQRMIGTNLKYSHKNLDVGFTTINTKLDKSLTQSTSPYKQFQFYGDELFNTGVDYSYIYRNVNLFGEFSYSAQDLSGLTNFKSLSYLNGAIISLDQNIGVSIFHRNYSKDYMVLNSKALGESSKNINEQGLYLGVMINPYAKWTVSAYFDSYKSAWLKYLVDAPSVGYEYMVDAQYKHSKALRMYWRLKLDNKQKNASGNETPSDYLVEHYLLKARYNISYKIAKTFTLNSRIEGSRFKSEGKDEFGYLAYQGIRYKKFGVPLSVSLRYALFDIDSYDGRIYVYESDILYAFSIPFFYSRGARAYILLRYTPMKGVDFWLKVAQTYYNNRETIGSSKEMIDGNTRTEVKLQMRLKF